MMMTSQGVVEQNQKFIENVDRYSKIDVSILKMFKNLDYSDTIYTNDVTRFYVRVLDENIVNTFDNMLLGGNTVILDGASRAFEFRIDKPMVYVSSELVKSGSGYGLVIGSVTYRIEGEGVGTGRGYFVVQFDLSGGVVDYEFKYGKISSDSSGLSLYLVFLKDKGVFYGFDNPSRVQQLFDSRGSVLDPVNGEPILFTGGGV